MPNNMKVSLFLAHRSIKRGNIGTTILTILIMSLIFVNLIFMPSIIEGFGEAMAVSSIDGVYGHIFIEPKEEWMPVFYAYEVQIDNHQSFRMKTNIIPQGCCMHLQSR